MKKDAKTIIEKIGVLANKAGYPPANGRIIGYLMISDPPRRNFEDIQKDLKLSKSAVSTALNMLMSMNMIDYITIQGDRKRYFSINPDGCYSIVKAKVSTQISLTLMIEEAMSVRSDKHPEFNKKLDEMLMFNVFMNKEIKAAIEKWEKLKSKK